MSNLKNKVWELGFASWGGSSSWKPGYSVLLPVPADLPVFLKLGVQTVLRQKAIHRQEVLVIPDSPTPEFRRIFEQVVSSLQPSLQSQFRLVEMGWKDQKFRKFGDRKELFLQIVNGARHAKGSHFLIHDADAFVLSDIFFESHYQQCVERNLSVIGVNPVWDDWYPSHGYSHLVATWEMICSQAWFRQFSPHMHRGQETFLSGEKHSCDITCYTQCLSNPEEIGLFEGQANFVHFNHVIRTYRLYLQAKSKGELFLDENFRLLLIRLLVDGFDGNSDSFYDLPTLKELRLALSQESRLVTFSNNGIAQERYLKFRQKLTQFVQSIYLNEAQRGWFLKEIQLYDRHYNISSDGDVISSQVLPLAG